MRAFDLECQDKMCKTYPSLWNENIYSFPNSGNSGMYTETTINDAVLETWEMIRQKQYKAMEYFDIVIQ